MKEFPQITGYEIRRQVGRGASGVVYEAVGEDGSCRAIKVFVSISTNPSLLERQIRRVMAGDAAEVTVPVVAEALGERPALVVMPFYGMPGPGGAPRNLQMTTGKALDWSFLLKLAGALRTLHEARVAHGNLKPGNIFLSDEGDPLLADYASGLMPGVHQHHYSDALLYAPPEQLRDPEGYLEEAGYRWDVHAFGVLAYRFLFQRFPRADGIFEPVSPDFGTVGDFEIEADHEGIARALESDPEVIWPTEPDDEVEVRRREILVSCLSLDAAKRPHDMGDVCRRFEAIERELTQEQEQRKLTEGRLVAEQQREQADRRFAIASLVALGLGGGWGVTQYLRGLDARASAEELAVYEVMSEGEISKLKAELGAAEGGRDAALRAGKESRQALELAQQQARVELRSARKVNDELFDWVFEDGGEELPALEERKVRLGILLQEIDQQLAGMAAKPSLKEEEALLRLRGAEVALAMENLEEGRKRLNEALSAGAALPGDAEARLRLRLLLLGSRTDPAALGEEIAEEKERIRAAYAGEPAKLLRAEAALSLIRARISEAKGGEEKSLANYLAALERFQELEERFPKNPAITFAVGRTALAAARSSAGEEAEAARLRAEAAEAFETLAGKLKKPSPEVEYQLTAAQAGQAIARWQQGDLFGAEKLARENLVKLTALEEKMPGDFRIAVDRASQKGIVATSLRDEGKAEEAREILSEEVASLQAGLTGEQDHGRARYLLASLKWQLSGVVGSQGEDDLELKLAREARAGLESLLTGELKEPDPAEIRRSLAYLCGDLGHAAERHGELETAVSQFEACRKYWEELAQEDGESPEVREGRQWAVDRLAALREQ